MKKIVIMLVTSIMFSSVFLSAKAEEKNTTSNAVTTFYGEYKAKEDNTEGNSNLSGNTPNTSNGQNNTGQIGNGSSNELDYDTSGSNGSSNSGKKVIPHTGNTPYMKEQVLGYSLLASLFLIPIIIQKKEF